MPNIDFYMARDNKIELIQHILDVEGKFIPDLQYSQPEFVTLQTLKDVVESMNQTRLFFISRQDFCVSPLEMRRVVKNEQPFFYVYPRAGGPTIQFYVGPEYEKNGVQYLASSFLSCYPWYENTLNKEKEKPPADLFAFYRELAALIRFRCDRIRPGVRTYWICKKVEAHIRAGVKLVGLESFTPDQIIASRR